MVSLWLTRQGVVQTQATRRRWDQRVGTAVRRLWQQAAQQEKKKEKTVVAEIKFKFRF
jgi:hypothetical protein